MKLKEYGAIILWLAEHDGVSEHLVGEFAYHFRTLVDDSEENLISKNPKNSKLTFAMILQEQRTREITERVF